MTSKSKLSEYCQKNSLQFPSYQSDRIGGYDHNPEHKVIIKLGEIEFSHKCKKIKEGENTVAEMLYNFLINQENKKENKIKDNGNIELLVIDQDILNKFKTWIPKIEKYNKIIFTDLENVNLSEKDVNLDDTFFITFKAKNCSKSLIRSPNVLNIICPFIGKDVADTSLILFVGMIYNSFNNKIYIYTKDHYGDALARFVNGYHICDLVGNNDF